MHGSFLTVRPIALRTFFYGLLTVDSLLGIMDTATDQVVLLFIILFANFANGFWFMSSLSVSSLSSSANRLLACESIPGLLDSQLHLCVQQPEIMWSIGEGVRAGIDECQNQFRTQRWNCSTIHTDNQKAANTAKLTLHVGTREGAFVQAITSAGVVNAIARACASGELSNCSCEPAEGERRIKARDERGQFQWTGCEPQMTRFAVRLARKFVDAGERTPTPTGPSGRTARQRDGEALINLHNNRAGRKLQAVQGHLSKDCKCHGVSGSCTVRTCWKTIPGFRQVGVLLRSKYDRARKVTLSDAEQNWKSFFSSATEPPLKKSDLVYYERSPDYCSPNHWLGSLGTGGRICKVNSTAPDSCEIMCCGRGYDTRQVVEKRKCQCKFQWCCDVKCSQCQTITEQYVCKPDALLTKPVIYNRPRERPKSAKRRFIQPNNLSLVSSNISRSQYLTSARRAIRVIDENVMSSVG